MMHYCYVVMLTHSRVITFFSRHVSITYIALILYCLLSFHVPLMLLEGKLLLCRQKEMGYYYYILFAWYVNCLKWSCYSKPRINMVLNKLYFKQRLE